MAPATPWASRTARTPSPSPCGRYGVGPGDEVVTVANTFIATGEAILLNGAVPVFVDVDEGSFTMDPEALEGAITSRTKVILPVHLYGHPAPMDEIRAVAGRHGLPVLEDAAQAHGAEIAGRRAGSLGHAACFSFYPGKNLGAYGDAGMVVTSDSDFAARVRQVANHGGGKERYDNVVPGTNSRLDALQAAVLGAKLPHLEAWTTERRERAAAYARILDGVPGVVLPREQAWGRSAWHLYTLRVADRDGLQAHLAARGIATAVHYPRPIHLQPAMATAGGRVGDLPVSERLSREVIQVPLYPELPVETLERIAREIQVFCGAGASPAAQGRRRRAVPGRGGEPACPLRPPAQRSGEGARGLRGAPRRRRQPRRLGGVGGGAGGPGSAGQAALALAQLRPPAGDHRGHGPRGRRRGGDHGRRPAGPARGRPGAAPALAGGPRGRLRGPHQPARRVLDEAPPGRDLLQDVSPDGECRRAARRRGLPSRRPPGDRRAEAGPRAAPLRARPDLLGRLLAVGGSLRAGAAPRRSHQYPFWKSTRLAWDAITSFSSTPLRWMTVIGLVVSLAGLVQAVRVIVDRLLYPDSMERGWASVVAIMLFLGVQLVSLGLIGQYVGRIFEESKKRPLYFVRRKVGRFPAGPTEG